MIDKVAGLEHADAPDRDPEDREPGPVDDDDQPVVQASTEAVLRYYLWGAAGQPPEPGPAPALVPESGETPPGDDQTKVRPDCAETVMAAARICRFCRHQFSAAENE